MMTRPSRAAWRRRMQTRSRTTEGSSIPRHTSTRSTARTQNWRRWEPQSPQAEVFRLLRTNLEFVRLTHSPRTILVTSAIEREGKSTTCANLAITLARAGQRVALVDLDLRRPSLARFFDLIGRLGLT